MTLAWFDFLTSSYCSPIKPFNIKLLIVINSLNNLHLNQRVSAQSCSAFLVLVVHEYWQTDDQLVVLLCEFSKVNLIVFRVLRVHNVYLMLGDELFLVVVVDFDDEHHS